jgi:microcystin-dependent protein
VTTIDPRLFSGLIEAVDTRFDQLRRRQPYTAYGVVASVDGGSRKAAVYVSGDSTPSLGFSYGARQVPEVDDRVRVVIDPGGDRWIDEVLTDLAAVGAGSLPSGSIIAYGGSSAPTGYLICDGSAVSRTTYADLFAVLGTTYGAGNGSTTFNLPNLRQRFPLGKAASGTGNTLGATGGSIDHVHSGPSHTHAGPSHTHTTPNHQHRLPIYIGSSDVLHWSATPGTYGNSGTGEQDLVKNISGTTESVAGNRASYSSSDNGGSTGSSGTDNTGSGGTGNTGSNNAPFQVVNYIIKI